MFPEINLGKIRNSFDPDRILQGTIEAGIFTTSLKQLLQRNQNLWSEGNPLKILFVGYNGSRNTGGDVRVEEMIRQVRHVLGDDEVELSLLSIDKKLTAGYFRTVRQIHLPPLFPKFLAEECPKHHGVIACEGSMFKSKFADVITLLMGGALGIANAEQKLSVGYGAEVGHMRESLQKFVKTHCRKSFVMCRNQASQDQLREMGFRTSIGTDTAWTFEPDSPEVGRQYLKDAGWDGKTPIFAVAPINPFWWPVRPDLAKATIKLFSSEYDREHYKSVYFHQYSKEDRDKYREYLEAIAGAMNVILKEKNLFPVLIGMEQLDKKACQDLSALLPTPAPIFNSSNYDMYELVSVLRNSSYLLSSRYHAVVCSMPAQIPSAGVTMDERIRNLMIDRGHRDLFLEVGDEKMEERLISILRRLIKDSDSISDEVGKALPRQLQLMGQMGIDFADEVSRVYPEFPRKDLPRKWDAHLPPLSKNLNMLLEKYA